MRDTHYVRKGLAFCNKLKSVGVSHPYNMRTVIDPVSEMLCSLEYRTMDEVQKPVIPSVIHHRRNALESALKYSS
jgi:hypothetical protein